VAFHGLNLDALLAAVITGLLLAPVYLFVDLGKGALETFLAGLGLFLVGAVMTLAGRRPRVLFLPVWLIGLGGATVGMVQQWGWWTLGLTVVVLFLVLVGLATLGWRLEAREWRQAPAALEEAKLALLEGDQERVWRSLEQAAYVPAALHLKVEMVRHARALAEFLHEHLEAPLAPESRAELAELRPLLDPARLPAGRLDLEKRLKALLALIKRRGQAPPVEPVP
jgi:hypothetical protein